MGLALLFKERIYSRGGCGFYVISYLLCKSLYLVMTYFFLPSLTSG